MNEISDTFSARISLKLEMPCRAPILTSSISSFSISIKKLRHCFLTSFTYFAKWLIALIPAMRTSIESSSSINSRIPVTYEDSCCVCCIASFPAFFWLLFIYIFWFAPWTPICTNFCWKKLSFWIIWMTVESGICLIWQSSSAHSTRISLTMALI